MNWKKMLKSMGISMGVCLALVVGVMVAYSQMVQEPDVDVDRPPVLRPPDSTNRDNNQDDWYRDFTGAFVNMPGSINDTWDDWIRRESFFTMLVLALDEYRNADVMWVVSFCTILHEMHIVDIPRDIRVTAADRNVQRINAAFANGRNRDGHEEGVRQAKREVAWLIGFQVDFYVIVEMRMFARAVDEILGGVTVTVPHRMEYYSPGQNLHINLAAGTQRLNGTQAVHFARWRQNTDHTGNIGTEGRMENIFHLFNALVREAWSGMPGILLQLPNFINMYNRYVHTDLGASYMMFFGEQFLRNDVSIHFHRIPVSFITSPRWYDVPYHDETLEIINNSINPFIRDIRVIMPDELPILLQDFEEDIE